MPKGTITVESIFALAEELQPPRRQIVMFGRIMYDTHGKNPAHLTLDQIEQAMRDGATAYSVRHGPWKPIPYSPPIDPWVREVLWTSGGVLNFENVY